MEKNPIISKVKKSYLLVLPIGGIGMLLISYFLIKNSFSDEFAEVIGVILGGFFGLAGIVSLVSILSIENLVLENKKLKIYSLTGKLKREIPISDIESYKEIEKEGRIGKYTDLIIFTKDFNYTISSLFHSNYESLKKKLTQGKKKNSYAQKMWHYKIQRRYGIGFSTLGILMLLFFGNIYLKKDLDILPENLAKIEGTVLKDVEIKKYGERKSDHEIEIELEEFPKFRFTLRINGLKATRVKSLLANVLKGDNIEIEILKDQFQKKITKEVPLRFWDKSFNYRIIGIYGLKDEQNSYFDLNQFNKNKKLDNNSGGIYILLGFSLLILGTGIYKLVSNNKPIAKNS